MKFLFNSEKEKDKIKLTPEGVNTVSKPNVVETKTENVVKPLNGDIYSSVNVKPQGKLNGILNTLKTHKKFVFFILMIPISIVLVIIFLYLVVLSGGGKKDLPKISDAFVLVESKIKAFDINSFYYPLSLKVVTVRDKQNPINGMLLTTEEYNSLAQYRPIAVSTDNQSDARPQSGLSVADMVYEFPVEGGISRYLAIYWSSFPVAMGPVRSFRTYFGDIVQEYDALLYHIGQAEIPDGELQSKPELAVYDSSTYFSQNSIKRTSCGYFRDEERIKNKVATEHTAYIDTGRLRSCVSEDVYKGLPVITGLKYKADMDYSLRSNNSSATISFNSTYGSAVNKSEWVYERTTNTYRKVINGKDDIDRNNSEIIKVKNIIIVIAPMKSDYGASGRVAINLIGQGKAVFLLDGKVTEGIWQKDSKTSRTKYYKSDGAELELNRGKIWVAITGSSSSYQVQ